MSAKKKTEIAVVKKDKVTEEEQRALFSAIIESTVDAIISNDLAGIITSWNAGAEKLFGYLAEETIGRHFSEFMSAEYADETEKVIEKIRAGEWVGHYTTARRNKNGSIIYISLSVAALKNAEGDITGVCKIARNITQQKLDERNVQVLNELLEQKVRARTAELEAANRELEAFSYTVSHDLQGPLRALSGFSRILLTDYGNRLEEDAKMCLKTINSSVKHMSDLIQGLLNFSKLGKAALKKEPINMGELVTKVVKEVQGGTSNFNAQVKIGELEKSVCDPVLIRQVWINLVYNAVKYSSKRDCPVVEIGQTVGGNCPVYYIKDNGVGFDMKFSHKLFGVFQRLHSAEEFEGTGVGLATVHRIVDLHGGKVWAEAKLNEGATFYFTLCEN